MKPPKAIRTVSMGNDSNDIRILPTNIPQNTISITIASSLYTIKEE